MSTRSDFNRIHAQLEEWRTLLPSCSTLRKEVSHWSVGQHLDHCLKVNESVLSTLEQGAKPEKALPSVSMTGRIVLWTGYIPRGVGKSPKEVSPAPQADPKEADRVLDDQRRRLSAFAENRRALSDRTALRSHPYFGGFNARHWIRFLSVHQNHHLKITREIAS